MEPADWYIEGCTFASIEEIKQFNDWTAHLPKREESTPYHSGAHSIKHFRNAFAIAGANRPTVLEVGFCLGHSAEIMFRLGACHVTSIENSSRAQTVEAASLIQKKWGDKHWMLHPEKLEGYIGKYDFGYIDGDHSAEAIRGDIGIMRQAKAEWVLFDDFWPHWGDTQIVLKEQGITPVAILGTMALCHFPA